ncbi:ABC transporter permease [Salibacterium aidingense]|uniref:ABC transporter permease n=1 Tax=Salibacterium aidingense TaxID=384933 RepID=UPI0003FCCA9B|nr:ABC transporter permease [Salibacterium aidingense]
MTSSLKRIYAILNKDLKDLSKNMYVLSTVVVPIFMAAVFARSGNTPLEIHYLVVNLAFATVAAFVQCALIAEEKEKNTLRGLMMSPASTAEILTGKSLVSVLLTLITLIVCMRITGYTPEGLPIISIALLVTLIFYVAMGTMLGLLTRSLMEASVVILPIMFIFGMGTLLIELIQEYEALMFIEYLPNFQLEIMAQAVESGASFEEVAGELGIMAVWMAVMVVLTVAVYRRRTFDGE